MGTRLFEGALGPRPQWQSSSTFAHLCAPDFNLRNFAPQGTSWVEEFHNKFADHYSCARKPRFWPTPASKSRKKKMRA